MKKKVEILRKRRKENDLGAARTPAFMVSWLIRATDLGSTLEALPYWVLTPAPDGTKNAPFTKISPSVRQFHADQSVSAASKRLVTYYKLIIKSTLTRFPVKKNKYNETKFQLWFLSSFSLFRPQIPLPVSPAKSTKRRKKEKEK